MGGEGNLKTEAETGARAPQAEVLSGALEEAGRSSLQPSEEVGPC